MESVQGFLVEIALIWFVVMALLTCYLLRGRGKSVPDRRILADRRGNSNTEFPCYDSNNILVTAERRMQRDRRQNKVYMFRHKKTYSAGGNQL